MHADAHNVIARRRKRLRRSEQTMQELENLGPIVLNLNNQKLTFDNGQWIADPALQMTEGGSQTEVKDLRREKRKLRKEVEKYMRKAEEMKTLKEKMNLLDFKYQLLLEMASLSL
ncbi:hypothetical protein O6H91_12G045100 [Diphasiastrum complanatum]|uniref:Uncharacterized protein n=1 Tax=Diphasiastrum complanatum TaxID=34168 RepID=A0ACC2C170_DIPCM|nr:hypothetical protein O6H91_Y212600 [Diphasiastrum complanatum]KAJ7535767.1 hypothetical protein O6H91_12G045100 [Diphasiastrum complanatum]